MKTGFIGIGRMGQAMARRLLDGGHDVSIYNRTAEKLKPLIERGAKALESISAATHYGEAVFTMLADDAAVMDVATKPGGLVESLRKGCIHICAGTHSCAGKSCAVPAAVRRDCASHVRGWRRSCRRSGDQDCE